MVVFVGTAAADGGAYIDASTSGSVRLYKTNFLTTDNVFARGYIGPESAPEYYFMWSSGLWWKDIYRESQRHMD